MCTNFWQPVSFIVSILETRNDQTEWLKEIINEMNLRFEIQFDFHDSIHDMNFIHQTDYQTICSLTLTEIGLRTNNLDLG